MDKPHWATPQEMAEGVEVVLLGEPPWATDDEITEGVEVEVALPAVIDADVSAELGRVAVRDPDGRLFCVAESLA